MSAQAEFDEKEERFSSAEVFDAKPALRDDLVADAGRGWLGETGSEVIWETVFKGPNLRIWFAEGKVKPGPLLPPIPVKAVVVLRHVEAKGMEGEQVVQHQSDLYVHTDNKSAALATRMLG